MLSGIVSDVIASTSTELSAGFTLRMNGGLGRLFGSWPPAALIAACTSCAAASMLRSSSNCNVIWVPPRLLFERRGDVRRHGFGAGAGKVGVDLDGGCVDLRQRGHGQADIRDDSEHQ